MPSLHVDLLHTSIGIHKIAEQIILLNSAPLGLFDLEDDLYREFLG